MANFIASTVMGLAPQVIGAVYNYGAEAVGGYLGVKQMQNTHDEIQAKGKEIAGPIGETVGDLMGRSVAGLGVDFTQEQKQTVTNAFVTLGKEAVNIYANREQIKEESGLMRGARVLGVAVKTIAIPAAVAAGAIPAAPAVMAAVAVKQIPEIVNAITTPVNPEEKVGLIEDVVLPAAKDIAIQAAGTVAQGTVIYNTVMGAKDERIKMGEQVARGVTSFLPSFLPKGVQNFAGQVGKTIGGMDSGRYALSDAVVAKAKENGAMTKNVVGLGLGVVDAAVAANKTTGERTYLNTAKNVVLVGAGVVGAGALVVVAPQAAALAGGAALLTAAPNAIRWMKQYYASPERQDQDLAPQVSEIVIDQAVVRPLGG